MTDVPEGPDESADEPPTGSVPLVGEVRPRLRSVIILFALMAGAGSLYYWACQLRFEQFYAGNWDLGINMQLLWSNTHGQLLYEAGDYETAFAKSFLFVHPAYIAIPISYGYAVVPSASTLFALQAGVVAFSAVPLYLIGRDLRTPDWVLVGGLAVYLLSFPVISGILFDFHWEAFIPAEFLWTYYLFNRGKFWWTLLPAVLGVLTLEVFPVLLLGLVAYFVYPQLRAWYRGRALARPREWRTIARNEAPLLALTTVAVVGYLGSGFVAHHVLPSVVGARPIFPPTTTTTWMGVPLWGATWSNLGSRLEYWLLLFAAFGFLPLLYRRQLLILSVPWAVYTVLLNPNAAFTQFGFQYALVAVAPLAIALIEGLGAVSQRLRSPRPRGLSSFGLLLLGLPLLALSVTDSVSLLFPGANSGWLGGGLAAAAAVIVLGDGIVARPSRPTLAPRRQKPRFGRHASSARRVALISAIVVLVAGNVAMTPFNVANDRGAGAGGYSFTYSPSPSYPYMADLVAKIPAGATVVASDNLFPFVANRVNAYSLLWYPATPPYLPFNASHLPAIVLVSTSQWFAVPTFLNTMLFNSSAYGLEEVVYNSDFYPGSIFLFQLGFTGADTVVTATPFQSEVRLCANSLALGASGRVLPIPVSASTPCGNILQSYPAKNLSGNGATLWYGPYSTLLAGNYSVTVSLRGELAGPGPVNAPILVMNANALGTAYWYDAVIAANVVSNTAWTNFTYQFQLKEPHPQAEWRGYLAGVTENGTFVPGYVQLSDIQIDYTPLSPSP